MTNKEITWKRNVIFTTGFMLIPSLIGFVYPNVSDWVGLIGGFCMTSLGITFPAIIGLKFYWNKNQFVIVALIAMWAVVMSTLGYCSGVLTLMKMMGVIHINM